jgi:DNA ligase-1
MSGFSDVFYKSLLARYPKDGTSPDVCWPARGPDARPGSNVDTNGLTPDFWFWPSEVWEVKGAECVWINLLLLLYRDTSSPG